MENIGSYKFQLIVVILLFCLVNVGRAQQKITGTVTDAQTGNTMPGVNILVVGTSTGTATDANGHFSLQVESVQDTLRFTFIGYQTKTVPINGRTEIDVVLKPKVFSGQQLVVVGYGTQKKGTLTSAVSSISSEELNVTPVAGVGKALQGKVSGLNVTRNGGPGTEPIVHIRGISSISFASDPLYVIDGMPTGNLSSIDNNDIASVQVLKGASAAAIYGSRATNGVILITTKKGANSPNNSGPRINFKSTVGVKSVHKRIDLLNTDQYLEYVDRIQGLGTPSRIKNHFNDPIYSGAERTYAETNTDWQDAFFRKGLVTNEHLSLSGGDDKTTYYLAGGYYKNNGIAVGQKYNRFNFRVNTQHTISDVFDFGETLYIAHSLQHYDNHGGNRTLLTQVVRSLPYLPVYDPTTTSGYRDSYAPADAADNENPILNSVFLGATNDLTKILGTAYLDVNFTPWLQFKSSFGLDYTRFYQHQYTPIYNTGGRQSATIATITNNRNNGNVKKFTEELTFDKTFGNNHIKAQAIYEQQINNSFNIQASGNHSTNGIETLAGATNISDLTSKSKAILMSYIGRINYQYAGKYLFSAAIRRDGLSIWAPGHKFANFPSGSIGWRIDKEGFMQNQSLVSELKIRAGYGVTGLNGFLLDSYYPWQVLMQTNSTSYPFGNAVLTGNGSYYNKLGNPDLSWEKTKQLDIGLKLGFLSNRVTLVADYYRRHTDNLLLQVPTPPSLGYYQTGTTVAGVLSNVGAMQNNGLDLKATYRSNSGGNFTWNISGLVSMTRNTVNSLSTPNGTIGAGGDQDFGGGDNITLTKAGHPIQSFYGYVTDGIFQNWDQVYNASYQNQALKKNAPANPTKSDYNTSYKNYKTTDFTAPGDIRFKDLNGDGVINTEDKTFIGNYIPAFTYSLNFNASYKNFHFGLLVSGVQGNKIFDGEKIIRSGMVRLFNSDTDVLNSWTPQNKNTNIPRAVKNDPNTNARVSTRWIEDGSYLRVKNLRIGYSIPASVLQSFSHGTLSNLKIYIASQNLLTITGYKGFDPEIGSKNGTLTNGIDYGTYPAPRSFLFGLELGF
jgi:TonB-linked SusC/RagA family outer membrane protein